MARWPLFQLPRLQLFSSHSLLLATPPQAPEPLLGPLQELVCLPTHAPPQRPFWAFCRLQPAPKLEDLEAELGLLLSHRNREPVSCTAALEDQLPAVPHLCRVWHLGIADFLGGGHVVGVDAVIASVPAISAAQPSLSRV